VWITKTKIMIDIRKALSQRCYIIFDTNEQLVKFVEDNNIEPYIGISSQDVVISVHPEGDYVTIIVPVFSHPTQYHHSELTITDDGE
jgi:Holliday junction resolvase